LFANAEDNLTIAQLQKVEELKERLENITSGEKDNVWLERYSNYQAYQALINKLTKVDEEVKKLQKKLKYTKNRQRKKQLQKKLKDLTDKQEVLEKRAFLLEEYKKSPFFDITDIGSLPPPPTIDNPFLILSGFSYLKRIKKEYDKYIQKHDSITAVYNTIKESIEVMQEMQAITKDKNLTKKIETYKKELKDFKTAVELSKTSIVLYKNRYEEAVKKVNDSIKAQIAKLVTISIAISVVFLFSLFFKYLIKKYITDNERFYTANKIINFLNFTIVILILLFSYIENVTYLVTVVGFASAGLAIAMKDLFMSMLGWLVIVFGGSFHVGDRVKVKKDGLPYVGDIVDISLLRMTVLEDITLTSYMENRRSGRVVFIPNNYIFTNLISNYTHMTLKTVWDGIDVTITFESNHKKAMYIIREITKKYSKGYTEIARKQLNKLRSQYSLKNTNVEPRIYSFIEPYGIRISSWYMTNSYAALTLRSTISSEIIEELRSCDDIKIAYPTQTINLQTTNTIPPDIAQNLLDS
jgi:small-conductance mechanosensitive channel